MASGQIVLCNQQLKLKEDDQNLNCFQWQNRKLFSVDFRLIKKYSDGFMVNAILMYIPVCVYVSN